MKRNPNRIKFLFSIRAVASYLLIILLAVPAFADSKTDTSNAPKQTILNKTGARPGDYDKKVWLDEKWGAHAKVSYEKFIDSFSSPKAIRIITAQVC